MQHTKDDVRVAPSEHGQGVYALRPLATGEFLGPFQGEIVDDPEYGSDYCIDLGDRILEPVAPFRYLNHSCQPNCALVVFDEDADDPSAWLEVLREVAPGEQLTIDYAWPSEAAIPCGCGAAGCRGWIVAADELAGITPADELAAVAG